MYIKALLTAAALALAAIPTPVFADKIEVGKMAPKFQITLIDGTKIRSDELRGQVVVLNFWATWCVPCRTELPTLDAYYRVQKKFGLRVFAVATEDSLPTYKLKPLFAALAIDSARRITGAYADVTAVPTNYIIGRDGRIRYAKAGAFDLDDLNTILVPLLKEPAPPPVAPAAPAGG